MTLVHISIQAGLWYAQAKNKSKECRFALIPAISFCDRLNAKQKRGPSLAKRLSSRRWAQKGSRK